VGARGLQHHRRREHAQRIRTPSLVLVLYCMYNTLPRKIDLQISYVTLVALRLHCAGSTPPISQSGHIQWVRFSGVLRTAVGSNNKPAQWTAHLQMSQVSFPRLSHVRTGEVSRRPLPLLAGPRPEKTRQGHADANEQCIRDDGNDLERARRWSDRTPYTVSTEHDRLWVDSAVHNVATMAALDKTCTPYI